jgi:lipopolysaccharide/colanic/teichoic acid biosynthesis glycosyltransferase
MELDTQYIDLWSLGLVFKILAKTIPAVLKGAGAA